MWDAVEFAPQFAFAGLRGKGRHGAHDTLLVFGVEGEFVRRRVTDALPRPRCRKAPTSPTEHRFVHMDRGIGDPGRLGCCCCLDESFVGHPRQDDSVVHDICFDSPCVEGEPLTDRIVVHLDAVTLDDIFGIEQWDGATQDLLADLALGFTALDRTRLQREGVSNIACG